MKIKYLIIMFLFFPSLVLAAPNATIKTGATSIENGKSVKVTVTLTDTAAWNIKIVGSGAATCSSKEANVTSDGKSTTKNFELSCTAVQEGTITFNVTGDITSGTAETKDISLSKEVTVTAAKSSVNTLSDLKVDGVTVSDFVDSKTSYTLPDNTGTNIEIKATATDEKATISGTGIKILSYGKNTFSIVVTAENGAQKTYTIIVTKPDNRSSNNDLKTLTIDKGTIEFNKNTTNYTVKVDHSVSSVTITATAEDSKAVVSGTGTQTLKDYNNDFEIIVKAENEEIKKYVVKVLRADSSGNYGKLSSDNSVKSITITNYEIKFDPNTKSYNILVEENVNKIDIKVEPNDSSANISISGNNNLKTGLNKVIVTITAENGNKNEYTFNVYKIGEEKHEEPTNNEKSDESDTSVSSNTSAGKESSNIWKIISIVEAVVLLILAAIFIVYVNRSKKKIKELKNGEILDFDVNNNSNNNNFS